MSISIYIITQNHMKKLLITLSLFFITLGVLAISTSAQSPKINLIYEKLDQILEEKPEMVPVLILKLQKIKTSYTNSPEKMTLLQLIIDYLQTDDIEQNERENEKQAEEIEKWPIIWSHIDIALPRWYNRLSPQDMEQMNDIFHFLWDEEAPIRVVEFLDFQCPYCQKQHFNDVLWVLRETEYPWKVRTSAAMFPLTWKRHELAQQAAEWAECTFIQWWSESYYWFKTWSYNAWLKPTMTQIRTVWANIWLDPDRLQACITEWHATASVKLQKNAGIRLWVRGTPWTVIIDSRTGAYRSIWWAQWPEWFMPTIEQLYNLVQ